VRLAVKGRVAVRFLKPRLLKNHSSKLMVALGALLVAASAGGIVGGLNLLLSQVYEPSDFYGNGTSNVVINSDAVSTNCPSGVGPHGPGNPCLINQVKTTLTGQSALPSNSITVTSTTGFTPGDTILVIQMTGTNAGQWEFSAVTGVTSATVLNITGKELRRTYSASSTQVIRVDKFNNVTVNSGGFLTTDAWNGSTGGVLALQVAGTLTLNDGSACNAGVCIPAHISTGYVNLADFTGGSGTVAARGFRDNGSFLGGEGAFTSTQTTPGSHEYLIMGNGSAVETSGLARGGGIIIVKAANALLGGRINVAGGPGGVNVGATGGTAYMSAVAISGCRSDGSFHIAGGTGSTRGPAGRAFLNYGQDPITPANLGSITGTNCSGPGTLFQDSVVGNPPGTIRRYHIK